MIRFCCFHSQRQWLLVGRKARNATTSSESARKRTGDRVVNLTKCFTYFFYLFFFYIFEGTKYGMGGGGEGGGGEGGGGVRGVRRGMSSCGA